MPVGGGDRGVGFSGMKTALGEGRVALVSSRVRGPILLKALEGAPRGSAPSFSAQVRFGEPGAPVQFHLHLLGGGGEAENGHLMVGLSRFQLARGELGVVGRVGKVLGFQAKAGVLGVYVTVLAVERSVEKIAGIELHPRLGRFYG